MAWLPFVATTSSQSFSNMYSITLESLNTHVNYFNKLKDSKLEFDVEQTSDYAVNPVTKQSYYEVKLHPHFKNIKDIFGVARIWQATRCPFKINAVTDFTGFQKIYSLGNADQVSVSHYKHAIGTVKFIAENVLRNLDGLSISLITKDPAEMKHEDEVKEKDSEEVKKVMHTYRAVVTSGDYYNGKVIYFANEDDAAYNYIDKGHIVISKASSTSPKSWLFVTDFLTLDMNYIIAAFSVYPECIEGVLQNKCFIPSKDCRMTLLKIEKNIPPKHQAKYQELRQAIQDDLSKNACNVMIGKLTRKESPFVDINNIRISPTKAIYQAGNVSIEAKNLAEVVFQKLNPNEEWDIFTLINIYTDHVEAQFKKLELNTAGTGFKEAKDFEFKINDIPIKVGVHTTHTRRSVNEHLINVDELSPVMKRASCYLPPTEDGDTNNKEDYERFVSNVSRHSLKIRDIWANGLPVKTMFLASDIDGSSHQSDATSKHPKLRFAYKDAKGEEKGFYLQVNVYDDKDKKKKTVVKTNEYRIGKFAEFIKKAQYVNKHAYSGHQSNYIQTHEGGWIPRSGNLNDCVVKLSAILTTYAAGISEADIKGLVGSVNYEMSEAEKRSEEMLNEACKMTGAKAGEKDGKAGFIIPGKLRTYFVERDSLKVYDQNSGAYFCVVNRGEQGVGKDALVARIFSLHNDSMLVKQIGTLR